MQTYVGPGQMLREARERRQLSLQTISRATMIRLDYLELIDAGELDRLPPGAYAKGFIRAYATYVGLDPKPLLRDYELRCGSAADVRVRRPVRVPNPAHPRTWRMAAGAALSALLVLGLLGIVRSGDRSAATPTREMIDETAALVRRELPALDLTAPPEQVQVSPNPAGAVVRLDVVADEVFVEGWEDGRKIFSGKLTEEDGGKRFIGAETVYLVIDRPKNVRLTANGKDLGRPPGSTTYRGTFTPTTTQLPPAQPR